MVNTIHFIGKVQEILEENWQKTIDTENGNVAKVLIKVSDKGTFSYKISFFVL